MSCPSLLKVAGQLPSRFNPFKKGTPPFLTYSRLKQPRLFNLTSPSTLMSSPTMIRWSADQSTDSKLDLVLNTVNRLQQDVATLNQAVQAQAEAIEDLRVGLAANTIRCDDMNMLLTNMVESMNLILEEQRQRFSNPAGATLPTRRS
ncbi:hypothetical protein L873DRAFT_1799022 [Choiromyces venosus 120613-1]|uniref:Uncharacterized protein n=1 Tax=Choiromyces venosus 120613-1 TaxID=1336337 RepID=A0A3N4K2V3_9PEZI|nr:hypothetical protein L873DRAFT_1799022 [Choiromyces venosus 120613-1]